MIKIIDEDGMFICVWRARFLGSDGSRTANSFAVRSHTCGELRKSDVGRKVKLCGWIQFQRLNKFVLLRDAYGVTQLVTSEQVCFLFRLLMLTANHPIGCSL